MDAELRDLIDLYNGAVDRYNLARLQYACEFDGFALPPTAPSMNVDRDGSERDRSAALAVQAVRDFFEDVFESVEVAETSSTAYALLHDASLELMRRFFQVSLTRMGISCRGMLD
jgi:hypothetical protein